MLKNTDYKCENKRMETILYRLRTEHNRLNMHLYKTDLNNSGLCDLGEEHGFDM